MVIIMSFDGLLLNRLKNEIEFLKTGRISKINESGDTDFIFQIRHQKANYNLMLSYSSSYSRIHLTNKLYDSILKPKSFTLFLRKHIEGYFIEDIFTNNLDRVLVFKLTGYNEIGDLNTKYLISEIMGRYSNMILTDNNYIIIDSLKHDGVSEYNRTILPNALYEFPTNNKLNPLDYNINELNEIFKEIKSPKDIIDKFNGLSYTFSTEVFKNDFLVENFYNYLRIENKPSIILDNQNKLDFYFNPFSYTIKKEYNTISELLDDYYYELDLKSKVKQKTSDLNQFINNQLKKYEKKLTKLESDLILANDNEKYKLYGELLLQSPNLKEKKDKETVFDYYNNEYIEIKLDNKISIIDNSNKYFKKYQKLKKSIIYTNEEINKTKSEIEYFKILKYQIEDATINEALEIQDELINNKYIFNKKITNTKKKKKHELLTYIVDDINISVGKNNIQNEYLTHQFAKKDEYWFHAKDCSGSHVVIHSNILTENLIRTAALLAAYYSEYKDSSSVCVDYTQIKNIKKIPGKRACFVTYKNQQSIYIDPDIEIINKLKVKRL